jgi:hypothetical protein
MEDVELAPDGSVVFLSRFSVHRVTGTSVTETALPRLAVDSGELSASLVVDEQNRVHAAWNDQQLSYYGTVYSLHGVYGILDGSTWTTYDLGDAPYPRVLRPEADALRVIHATGKSVTPSFALTELAPDGTLVSSRLISTSEPVGLAGSPSPGSRLLGLRGADGAIAATLPSLVVSVTLQRPATSLTPPLTATVTLEVSGQGRVFTADGQIDCAGTCTLEVPWGTRLPLRAEAAAGYTASNFRCASYEEEPRECWYDVVPVPYGSSLTLPFRFVPEG